MFESEKNKILLKKYQLQEKLQVFLSTKKQKTLKLYIDFMNDNLKMLKRINTTLTRSNIEITLNKQTSYPAFDWQRKIECLNNIFAMMMGIMDARIDDYKREINFYEKFEDLEEIKKIKLNIQNIMSYIKEIQYDYNENFERKEMKIIIETMQHSPSYENFNKLFDDMKENSYSLVIQGHLISAYMIGYNNSLYIHPEVIMPYYQKIISEYKLDKEKHNNDYQKVKKYNKDKNTNINYEVVR